MKKAMILAGLISITPMAFAEDVAQELFDALDANQDQLLSIDEAKAHTTVLAQFESLDINQDKHLSLDELRALKAS